MEGTAIYNLKIFMVTSFNQIVEEIGLDSQDVLIREVIHLKLVKIMEQYNRCVYEYGKVVTSHKLLASIDLQLIANVTAALLTSGVNAANLITDGGIRLEVGTSSREETEFMFAAISEDKTLIVSKFVRNNSKSTNIFLTRYENNTNSASTHAISPMYGSTNDINIKDKVINLIKVIIAEPKNTKKGGGITWRKL